MQNSEQDLMAIVTEESSSIESSSSDISDGDSSHSNFVDNQYSQQFLDLGSDQSYSQDIHVNHYSLDDEVTVVDYIDQSLNQRNKQYCLKYTKIYKLLLKSDILTLRNYVTITKASILKRRLKQIYPRYINTYNLDDKEKYPEDIQSKINRYLSTSYSMIKYPMGNLKHQQKYEKLQFNSSPCIELMNFFNRFDSPYLKELIYSYIPMNQRPSIHFQVNCGLDRQKPYYFIYLYDMQKKEFKDVSLLSLRERTLFFEGFSYTSKTQSPLSKIVLENPTFKMPLCKSIWCSEKNYYNQNITYEKHPKNKNIQLPPNLIELIFQFEPILRPKITLSTQRKYIQYYWFYIKQFYDEKLSYTRIDYLPQQLQKVLNYLDCNAYIFYGNEAREITLHRIFEKHREYEKKKNIDFIQIIREKNLRDILDISLIREQRILAAQILREQEEIINISSEEEEEEELNQHSNLQKPKKQEIIVISSDEEDIIEPFLRKQRKNSVEETKEQSKQ